MLEQYKVSKVTKEKILKKYSSTGWRFGLAVTSKLVLGLVIGYKWVNHVGM